MLTKQSSNAVLDLQTRLSIAELHTQLSVVGRPVQLVGEAQRPGRQAGRRQALGSCVTSHMLILYSTPHMLMLHTTHTPGVH